MKIVLKASDVPKVTKNLTKISGRLVLVLSSSAFTIQTSQESFAFTVVESEDLVEEKIVSVQLASDFVKITKKLSKKGLITITLQENTLQIYDESNWIHSLYVEESCRNFQPVVSDSVAVLQQATLLRTLLAVKIQRQEGILDFILIPFCLVLKRGCLH